MNDNSAAIDLSGASWEQFVGAVMRLQHFEQLLASARRPRRRMLRRRATPSVRSSYVLMLAITLIGFALL